MINPISVYQEAGRKQAIAQKQKDQGRVSHYSRWVSSAINLEKEEDKSAAREAYKEAYKEESGFYN